MVSYTFVFNNTLKFHLKWNNHKRSFYRSGTRADAEVRRNYTNPPNGPNHCHLYVCCRRSGFAGGLAGNNTMGRIFSKAGGVYNIINEIGPAGMKLIVVAALHRNWSIISAAIFFQNKSCTAGREYSRTGGRTKITEDIFHHYNCVIAPAYHQYLATL